MITSWVLLSCSRKGKIGASCIKRWNRKAGPILTCPLLLLCKSCCLWHLFPRVKSKLCPSWPTPSVLSHLISQTQVYVWGHHLAVRATSSRPFSMLSLCQKGVFLSDLADAFSALRYFLKCLCLQKAFLGYHSYLSLVDRNCQVAAFFTKYHPHLLPCLCLPS